MTNVDDKKKTPSKLKEY